jgi:hypothetical protein
MKQSEEQLVEQELVEQVQRQSEQELVEEELDAAAMMDWIQEGVESQVLLESRKEYEHSLLVQYLKQT